MRPPKHYSDWVAYFDMIMEEKEPFHQILDVLEEGTLEWTHGVAEKMISGTYKVLEFKLKQITRSFQTELSGAHGEEHRTVASIVNARSRFQGVKRICELTIFPEDVSKMLLEVVDQYIDGSQQSLLASAKEDRTGYLSSIVNHNKLTQASTEDMQQSSASTSQVQDAPNFKKGRRVLF